MTEDNDNVAEGVSKIKATISSLRSLHWPPQDGTFNTLDDLPFFHGSETQYDLYFKKWKDIIDQANTFYEMPDVTTSYQLPSQLGLPVMINDVYEVRIGKNTAKESKRFRGIASLLEKCGTFSNEHLALMQLHLSQDKAALVAHRPFVDLRAYVYVNSQADCKPIRVHFFQNGLIVGGDKIKIVDVRETTYKKRSDSYSDPIAENEEWMVYAVFDKSFD